MTNFYNTYRINFNFVFKTKTIAFLFLLNSFSFYANKSYSQQGNLSFNLIDVTISDVLNEIESLSDFKFIYKNKIIINEDKISFTAQNETVPSILNRLFSDIDIRYQIIGKQIVLNPKEKNIQGNSSGSTLIKAKVENKFLVKGIVKDSNGIPLPSASIIEKGTTNGTETDFNGSFILEVQNGDAILIVSYLGNLSQEIPINNRETIEVFMTEDEAI